MTLRLRNSIAELGRLHQALVEFASARGLDGDTAFQLDLCLEEVFSNIVRHGYAEAAAGEIVVELGGDDWLELRIEDDGRAFDPLAAAAPDTSRPAQERQPGGLGILIVRRLMDEVSYHRRGGKNVLLLRKKIASRRE